VAITEFVAVSITDTVSSQSSQHKPCRVRGHRHSQWSALDRNVAITIFVAVLITDTISAPHEGDVDTCAVRGHCDAVRVCCCDERIVAITVFDAVLMTDTVPEDSL
jgi:hypothetical protein